MKKIILVVLFLCVSLINLNLVYANESDESTSTVVNEYESVTEPWRNTIQNYRDKGVLKVAIDYCHATIKSKPSKEVAIEAYYQLADIYRNEFNVPFRVQKFSAKAISLVKSRYSKVEIEEFVNGEDALNGKTNSIRELYILKSELENVSPKLDENNQPHYRTDW